MPWTTNKGYSVQSTGSSPGTWGSDSTTPTANSSNALNEGVIQLLDQALGSTTTLSLTNVDVALTQAQTQTGMLRMTGTLTGNVAVSPAGGVLFTGFYCWENVTTGSFTVTLTNSAGSVVLPQSRRGLLWIDTTNGPRIIAIAGSTAGDPIPVGTVMLFYQTAAPTGWTISSSLNDYALKIVSATGGVTSGSVDYSTLFGRTTTDGTTLTTAQLPSHTHPSPDGTSFVTIASSPLLGYPYSAATGSYLAQPGANTGATGGGGSHTHPLDMRVKTASVILATKN